MTGDSAPLRLTGEGRLPPSASAVVLLRVDAAQFHLGLGRLDGPRETVLHLVWHRVLREQPLLELVRSNEGHRPCAVIRMALDPLLDEALGVLLRRVASRYAVGLQGPSYGYGSVQALFESNTGIVSDPDAAFTCATFVLQMLRSVGVTLLDATRWREPTEEDRRWQIEVGERLIRWIDEHIHGDLLHAKERIDQDHGARRFRPTDVAGAAMLDPEKWPASAEEVEPHARWLEMRLTFS